MKNSSLSFLKRVPDQIAINLDSFIQSQIKWIEKQESIVLSLIMAGTQSATDSKGYDLRQSIQALETGRTTLAYLNTYFEEVDMLNEHTLRVKNTYTDSWGKF